MLIAPVLPAPLAFEAPLPCDVCRIGHVCACCIHAGGAFLSCALCAQRIATAMVIRISFAQDRARELEPFPEA